MTTIHALSWSYAASSHSLQFPRCGGLGNFSRGDLKDFSSSLDSHRMLESGSAVLDTFARIHSSVQPSCSAGGAGERHVAGGRAKKSRSTEHLRSGQKQEAQKPPQASAMPVSFPPKDGALPPIALTTAHAPASAFLPSTPINIPFPEGLRLEGDSVSTSSVFRMLLTCCVAAQWIKIAGALSLWASRLRLKFFDSPLVYKNNSGKLSKLGRIGVFWDLENCPVPSGADVPQVIDKIRTIAGAFGEIQCFRAYGKLEYLSKQAIPFLNRDIELCPVPDGKESADKAIILDASLFALDHKPCREESGDDEITCDKDTVVLVTGDRGFAALLKALSKRSLTTVVIGNAHQALPSILRQSADFSLGWDDMMISEDAEAFFSVEGGGKLESTEDGLVRKICCYEGSEEETRRMKLQDSDDVECYQLDSAGSELLCIPVSEKPNPLVHGLLKVTSESPSEDSRKQQLQSGELNSCELSNSKFTAAIGGRIRVLRHLRCEVAAIAEKYCSKGKCIHLEEFKRLYELEMGHTLVPAHYGFAGLKVLLQSMPDLVSLNPISTDSPGTEVTPYYPKGQSSYGKINYSRDDLRCIMYELLRIQWPFGVKKDNLSYEHFKITGRPLVLVTYEFLKTGDVFGSMRDLMYIDSRTKQLHLVDDAQEPAGYSILAQNRWR